jgi:hypothetical protein
MLVLSTGRSSKSYVSDAKYEVRGRPTLGLPSIFPEPWSGKSDRVPEAGSLGERPCHVTLSADFLYVPRLARDTTPFLRVDLLRDRTSKATVGRTAGAVSHRNGGGSYKLSQGHLRRSSELIRMSGRRIQSSGRGTRSRVLYGGSRGLRQLHIQAYSLRGQAAEVREPGRGAGRPRRGIAGQR